MSEFTSFTFNLRFPGQVFDGEAGLHGNYSRNYDPASGRYVEADAIGLYGGLNLYSYVSASPTDGVDPLGTLRRGNDLKNPADPLWRSVEQAEQKIRDELRKSTQCHKNSNQDGCIPPFVADNLNALTYSFEDHLNRSFVDFDQYVQSKECGRGEKPGWVITIGPQSFEKRCDCLASTIYHELLHNIGLDHEATSNGPGINDLEHQCMGNLCGRSQP